MNVFLIQKTELKLKELLTKLQCVCMTAYWIMIKTDVVDVYIHREIVKIQNG